MVTLDTVYTLLKEFKRNTEGHFKELNGSVAEHSKWINENNKTITKDFPKIEKMARNNDKKLYALTTLIIVVQVLIGWWLKLNG